MVDLESGHRDKVVDKLSVKGISGHISRHTYHYALIKDILKDKVSYIEMVK